MRSLVILLGFATFAACAKAAPPDRIFAVFFDENSTSVDVAGDAVVARAAVVAKQWPALPVNVAGYSDRDAAIGDATKLSQARAEAVTAMLVADGVAASRIKHEAVVATPGSQPGVERRRVEIDIGDQ